MKGGLAMHQVYLIYGNEPQLIEEEKQKFFLSHKNLDVRVLHDEAGPSKISEQLMEDSLFGDAKVFCLINLPILKKAGQKESQEWDALAELLMNYTGDNPVLIIYHDMVDKRLKQNKKILESIPNKECKRLEGDDLLMWIRQYCTSNGYTLTLDGHDYLSHLLELWQDVPVAFKEALLKQDVNTLLELFPFMFSYKEIDRAMGYIEGQLRLQLLVSECRAAGMTAKQVENFCKENGASYKPYPIKLAYEASSRISIKALKALLKGLYEVILDSRTSKGDMWRFRDLCLTYCGYKG